ncbi:MAG: hypothetical protein HYR88_08305 [Verrucomicrobia bacterium]|nr:hypothetical protein [Verrucomicrobiota bacterium]MBI3871314.1 hypothetical protein [Verrucomicrobiota bacterium]
MGLLNFIPFLRRSTDTDLTRLPSGTFTMDRKGSIVSSTLPTSFPLAHVREIGRCVMDSFRAARQSRIRVNEIHIHYSTLKITAKEMKGSAVVFVMPTSLEESSY